MISFVAFSVRRAWQGFWRNGLMPPPAATTVLMLLLLAGFWAIQSFLVASLDAVEHNFEVRAFLYQNVTQGQVDDPGRDPGRDARDAGCRARHPRRSARPLPRGPAGPGSRGPHPLSRFEPAAGLDRDQAHHPSDLDAVEEALQDSPLIDGVQNVDALVDRLVTVTTILQTAGTVVLLAVALIVLFIIVNSIRLAVVARAEEIEVMRLVGASDAFIRWPFVFEGAFIGLLGAVVALIVLAAAAEPVGGFMMGFFEVLPLRMGSLVRDTAALVLGAGVGLGIIGSWVSVRTYLLR